jgi:hypothetical protein
MKTPVLVTFAALVLPLAACSTALDRERQAYEIQQPITALVVQAQAASVTVDAVDGPVKVEEVVRFHGRRPATSHRVDGSTLRLAQTGCGDAVTLTCGVGYRIQVPRTTAAEIRSHAGTIIVRGLGGRLSVTSGAGAVRGEQLSSSEVKVTTETGTTLLQFTDAPSQVSSVSGFGAVEVRVPGDRSYAVDVSTKAGRSTVSVPKDPAATHHITVKTELGLVKVAPLQRD